MIHLANKLADVNSVVIAGHIRPDGDAIGSCLGLYLYLKENYPEINCQVYLEPLSDAFQEVYGIEEICHEIEQIRIPDLFICLDCADEKRLGNAAKLLTEAKYTICIDHHISNCGLAEINYIVPEASSTSELVFTVLEEDKIPFHAAEALYMGIVHDTGVFRHSCTSPETMEIAAKLMRKKINSSRIINTTYYEKTYQQNQILGKALSDSSLFMEGKVISSVIRICDMEHYGVTSADLDGIVQLLMGTRGIEAAIFLYETHADEYKVSMRSGELVNVSEIAGCFGGGGHVRAAGCTIQGDPEEIIKKIAVHIEKQLRQHQM